MKATGIPVNSEAFTRVSYRGAVAWNYAGNGQRYDWVKRTRVHFDQPCQDAASCEERLRLITVQVDLAEEIFVGEPDIEVPKQVFIDAAAELKDSYPTRALLHAVGIAPSI